MATVPQRLRQIDGRSRRTETIAIPLYAHSALRGKNTLILTDLKLCDISILAMLVGLRRRLFEKLLSVAA